MESPFNRTVERPRFGPTSVGYSGGRDVVRRDISVGDRLTWTVGLCRSAIRSGSAPATPGGVRLVLVIAVTALMLSTLVVDARLAVICGYLVLVGAGIGLMRVITGTLGPLLARYPDDEWAQLAIAQLTGGRATLAQLSNEPLPPITLPSPLCPPSPVAAGSVPERAAASHPVTLIVDSQSVRGAFTVGRNSRGYDAAKRVNGRKRHITVDTLGLLLMITVTPADIQDRDAAREVFWRLSLTPPQITQIWADRGCAGDLVDWALITMVTRRLASRSERLGHRQDAVSLRGSMRSSTALAPSLLTM